MTRHTKENFARYLGTGQIIRRRDLSVHVAHAATGRARQASVGQAARDQSRQLSAHPDLATTEEAKRRFEICKTCEHSRDNGFACDLYHGCCFGKFRSNTNNRCLDGHW